MKNENPTLSIIIPVYNVEQYVDGTLESIYSQMFDENLFEVIVVNDGTPDGSMDIVAKYAEHHKNLKVVNQKNQGLSVARNNGLEVAQGEYVWFVDSDDQIMPGSLEYLTETVARQSVDIHTVDFLEVIEDTGGKKETRMILSPKKEHLYEQRLMGIDTVGLCHTGAAPHLVMRRKFLSAHDKMRFLPGVYFEDMEFMCRAFLKADGIVFHRFCAYRYLRRSHGSIMSSFKEKYLTDRLRIIESLIRYAGLHTHTRQERNYMSYHIKQHALAFYNYTRKVDCHEGWKLHNIYRSFLRRQVWRGMMADLSFCKLKAFMRGVMYLLSPQLEAHNDDGIHKIACSLPQDETLEKGVLTVFTPTYNRAYSLPALYKSLLRQDCRRFRWLVVDDGSTDDTRRLVEEWTREGKIRIEYHYQHNGGKMRAHNRGARLCQTELFMCLDSDDTLTPDAVSSILNLWQEKGNTNLAGVVASRQTVDEDGHYLNNAEFYHSDTSTLRAIYAHGFKGETALAFRTEVIRAFPFPVFEDEKFISEGYVYDQIDDCYEMLVLNKPVMICIYRNDGYTRNMVRTLVNNPKGATLAKRQKLLSATGTTERLRLMISYIAFAKMANYNNRKIIEKSGNPLLCCLLMPLGIVNKMRLRRIAGK